MSKEFIPTIAGGFAGHVMSQLKDMKVGDMIKADLNGETVSKYQMTSRYVAKKLNTKYKTRTSMDDNLWVQRIK